MHCTGHPFAACSAHEESSTSGVFTMLFPSSFISKTSGQIATHAPHPMHASLSTSTFTAITNHLLNITPANIKKRFTRHEQAIKTLAQTQQKHGNNRFIPTLEENNCQFNSPQNNVLKTSAKKAGFHAFIFFSIPLEATRFPVACFLCKPLQKNHACFFSGIKRFTALCLPFKNFSSLSGLFYCLFFFKKRNKALKIFFRKTHAQNDFFLFRRKKTTRTQHLNMLIYSM